MCLCYVRFVNRQPIGIETGLFYEIYIVKSKKKKKKKKHMPRFYAKPNLRQPILKDLERRVFLSAMIYVMLD